MLTFQFIEQNLHFAVNLFAALVFFSVFWLYFDAWTARKRPTDLCKWLAVLLISLSFLVQSTVIEQSVLGKSIFGNGSENLANILRLAGYIGLVVGQLTDPLQKKPKTRGLEDEQALPEGKVKPGPAAGVAGVTSSFGSVFALPLAALAVSLLYLRRATKGLERHLRPVALAFFLLAVSDAFGIAAVARNTANPNAYNLVKAFGPLWVVQYIFLVAAVCVLGVWIWRYLLKRFLSQLFMVMVGAVVIIFLLTTTSFSFLLLDRIQNSKLDNLQTANNVLGYALASKQSEAKADAEAVAANSQVISAVEAKDHSALAGLAAGFLQAKKQSSLVITDRNAEVLLRAEQPERWGDSVSSDAVVKRALTGQESSTVATTDGVLAPTISIKSAVPIKDKGAIIGSVSTGVLIDNGFVDGVKQSTGLEASVYSGDRLSATTLSLTDGTTRQLGVKLNDQAVVTKVIKNAQTYKGGVSLLNHPYFAVYTPLKDVNNNVVGMLFIGQSQSSVFADAGHSVELTFIAAAILIVISLVPAYFTARYISKQLE